ncbi:MAG TPA: hypothetical protein VN609_05520 [Propionibacteriaceae bacterium]|nr:hypothetical protein [Propionibacteriaceae bacterium]
MTGIETPTIRISASMSFFPLAMQQERTPRPRIRCRKFLHLAGRPPGPDYLRVWRVGAELALRHFNNPLIPHPPVEPQLAGDLIRGNVGSQKSASRIPALQQERLTVHRVDRHPCRSQPVKVALVIGGRGGREHDRAAAAERHSKHEFLSPGHGRKAYARSRGAGVGLHQHIETPFATAEASYDPIYGRQHMVSEAEARRLRIEAAQKQGREILEKARAGREPSSVEYIHTFRDGRQHKITFSSCFPGQAEELRSHFTENMDRIEEIGLEAVMQEWHDEEAKERRKLGLKVEERYSR